MKKGRVLAHSILYLMSFTAFGLGPWIIHIDNGTPMKLSVVHKFIYPALGGTYREKVVDVKTVGRGQKIALNQDQYTSTNKDESYQLAIGTVLEIQGTCGLGASPYKKTNRIVLARPFVFMQLQSVPRLTRNQLEGLVEREGLDKDKLSTEDLLSIQQKLFQGALGSYADAIMVPMVPSGSYRVLWNKNAPCDRSLTITQRNQVNPALNLYFP